MTDAERAKDEQVLAAIIAAAESSGRKMQPHYISTHRGQGSGNGYGIKPFSDRSGPACAVGMGCLFAGMNVTSRDPIDVFATAHDVSREYAVGVSLGFEGDIFDQMGDAEPEFARGYAVGVAAYYSTTIGGES